MTLDVINLDGKKMSLLSLESFSALYNHSINSAQVAESKYNPDYIVRKGRKLYIDTKKFNAYQDEHSRIVDVAHSYYFYLSYVIGIKDSSMAWAISIDTKYTYESWLMFFKNTLFLPKEPQMIYTIKESRLKEFILWAEREILKAHRKRLKYRPHLKTATWKRYKELK